MPPAGANARKGEIMIFGCRHPIAAMSAWLAFCLSTAPVAAQEFYKGKTVRVVVATTPGGGFFKLDAAVVTKLKEILK